MADLNDSNATSSYDNALVEIRASDNTAIGNVGDRLKVDALVSTSTISNYLINNQLYSTTLTLNMTTANVENPLIFFKNPSGSGKTVYIYKILTGSSITNVQASFSLYANPTSTANGTALTLYSRFVGNSAPASSMNLYYSPTISSNGSKLSVINCGENTTSYPLIDDFSIGLKANNTLLITGNPGSNNRESVITIIWSEV